MQIYFPATNFLSYPLYVKKASDLRGFFVPNRIMYFYGLIVNMTFKHFFTALLLLLSFAAQAQLDTTGLIAHWSFNGNFNDVTGRGHNGQLGYTSGNISIPATQVYRKGVNGDTASALQFRTNLIGGAPYQPDLNLQHFSIAAVVKFDTLTAGTLLFRGNGTNVSIQPSYAMYLTSPLNASGLYFKPGSLESFHLDYSYAIKHYTPATQDSTWYYVVMTYDGTYFKTFVNGILKNRYYKPNVSFEKSSYGLSIGGFFDSHWIDYLFQISGAIDDLRLYNRALADSEVIKYPLNFLDTMVIINIAEKDTVMCIGDTTLDVPYFVSKPYNPGNKFIVQISDTSGDFYFAHTIGEDSTNTSGTISCIIPSYTTPGYHHIRIISTAPKDTSFEFVLNYHPQKSTYASSAASILRYASYNRPQQYWFCKEDSINIYIYHSEGIGEPASSYQWQKNGANIPGANNREYNTKASKHLDSFRCIITSGHNCWLNDTVTSTPYIIRVDSFVKPTVTIDITPNDTVCVNDSFTVYYLNNKTNPIPSYAISWHVNSDTLLTKGDTLISKNFNYKNGDTIYCIENSKYATCALHTANNSYTSNTIILHIDSNIITPQLSISASSGGKVPYGTNVVFSSNYTGAGAAPEYQWLLNGKPMSWAKGPSYFASHTIHNSGDVISLKAKDTTSSCIDPKEATSNSITIVYGNGTNVEAVNKKDYSIYPNPNTGQLTIRFNELANDEVKVSVINTTGQVIYEQTKANSNDLLFINLPVNTPNGIYILKLNSINSTYSQHITINR